MTEDKLNELIGEDNVVEFSSFILGAFETFYRQDIGVTGATIWMIALKGKCTLMQLMEAMNAHASETINGKRLPQPLPADILARIGGTQGQAAWRKVIYAVRHFGANYSMKFDDLRIHSAIHDMGGWPHFCTQVNQRFESDMMREFSHAYSSSRHSNDILVLKGAHGQHSRVIAMKEDNGRLLVNHTMLQLNAPFKNPNTQHHDFAKEPNHGKPTTV